jgi:ankyrin repeat protein
MYEDLSRLIKDREAQGIYRYFKESFIYIKNPPERPNKKNLPKLPKLSNLAMEVEEGPIALMPTKLTSLMPDGVLQVLQEQLVSLVPDTFISLSYQELISLLHREKDYKSFMSHPFNQKLLALFVGLDSNTHQIPLSHFAAMEGDEFTLSKLLYRIWDISCVTDEYGNNPLHFTCATSHSNAYTLDLLLNIEPCKKVKKQQVKEFLKERVNIPNSSDETALHIACRKTNITAVQKLLKKGADCNVTDDEGYLPIHRAMQKRDNPIVDLLIKISNPEQLIKGKSILAIAYEDGDMQLVNYLINHALCINTIYQNTTILHEFCKHNENKLIKKLLNAGITKETLEFTDSEGLTPFRIACQNHDYTIMQALLDYGMNINHKIDDHTALHEACAAGDYKLAKFLLEHGADPEISDAAGTNCVALAHRSGNQKLCELFPSDDDDCKTMLSSSESIASIATMPEAAETLSLGSLTPPLQEWTES